MLTDKDKLAIQKMRERVPGPAVDYRDRSGTLAERMRRNVAETDSGCWEWRGVKNKAGYGLVSYQKGPGAANRTSTSAHRKFWELTQGPIPGGLQVNHKCDNRACINPDHMFLGTQTDNIRDMIGKGRNRFYGKRPRRA